jgi:hypothetical protein
MAIVTGIMLVTVPALIRYDRVNRVIRTARMLTDLDTLITNQNANIKDFHQRVGRNPSRLSHLTRPITTADQNACNRGTDFYTAGQVTNWQTWGPFGTYVPSPSGLETPIGMADDMMERIPNTGGAGNLAIVFSNVDGEDVEALDDYMDVGSGSASGIIIWTTPLAADGSTTMRYLISISIGC